MSLGTLDRVDTVLKVLGMVSAVPTFTDHPKVIDGCTDLFVQVLGEGGRPTRSAVGVGRPPRNIAVEVEAIVLVRELNRALTGSGAQTACFGCQNGAAIAVNLAMPNDFAIQSIGPVRAASDTAGEVPTVAVALPEPPAVTMQSRMPNPSMRLDPALGIVVLEFRSDSGAVTTSVPSQRQLQAYQKWDATHLGTAPRDGAISPVASAPANAQPAVEQPARISRLPTAALVSIS